ncbi:MAG: hypothetical protein EZS28_023384 [Streblomastix strix]|uniref:Uncharacterized protein n=1 Tax=Streblomastix strix TaxID=222440 RepID=A0A5J4VEQ8_9EUKA|nr:MAG: hypothetical protein EZS28_023384 [Streblomastix strix]
MEGLLMNVQGGYESIIAVAEACEIQIYIYTQQGTVTKVNFRNVYRKERSQMIEMKKQNYEIEYEKLSKEEKIELEIKSSNQSIAQTISSDIRESTNEYTGLFPKNDDKVLEMEDVNNDSLNPTFENGRLSAKSPQSFRVLTQLSENNSDEKVDEQSE